MSRARRPLAWIAAAAAAAAIAGCGTFAAVTPAPARPRAQAAPLPTGPASDAARRAVSVLAGALRAGDVERLCRPGGVFTAAVVRQMHVGAQTCEASLEQSPLLRHPPPLTVTGLELERDLATARVRVGHAGTVPLDLVRAGRRWLVSFSSARNPLPVIASSAARV